MKRQLTCLALIFGLSTPISAQQLAKGYVYEDANKNGVKEPNELGIANAGVSNSRDVVLTDQNGYYEIPAIDGNTIFVIKPAGYSLPVDEYFIPKYYYHHKPQGSPADFRYKGVAPTGPLPKSVDFPLYEYDEPENFSVIVFGDPQPYTMEDIETFTDKILKDVRKTDKTIFGISLGDIVGDSLPLHSVYKERMRMLGLPWFNVMGNHDMNYDAPSDILSDETFEKNFGSANLAFNYGYAHFIILDDIYYPDPRDGRGYWAGYRKDQLEFVQNDLKYVPKDKLVVISQHIQMNNAENDGFRLSDRQQLFDMLKDFNHVLIMSGHTHLQQQIEYTKADGWHGVQPLHEYNVGTTSGDWYSGELDANGHPDCTMRDGTPHGYAFLNINGNTYDVDYKAAGKPHEYQMNIQAPRVVKQHGRTSSMIVANIFMGSKKDNVEYRIDNGKWQKMRYMEDYDPIYMTKLYKWDFSEQLLKGRRPSNPVKSTHVWSGRVDTKLNKGSHTVEVRAKDRYGKVHHGKTTYEVH